MSRLTRDGTAEPVSRDQILRHAREQGNVHFPCSADHEQDWQPYPVDPYSAICDDHTYIHTYILAARIEIYDHGTRYSPKLSTYSWYPPDFFLTYVLLCCCCLHIKSRSGLYSVLSNIRTGPTDADAFRGHRLTTQKGYTYQKEIKGPRKVNTHAII